MLALHVERMRVRIVLTKCADASPRGNPRDESQRLAFAAVGKKSPHMKMCVEENTEEETRVSSSMYS